MQGPFGHILKANSGIGGAWLHRLQSERAAWAGVAWFAAGRVGPMPNLGPLLFCLTGVRPLRAPDLPAARDVLIGLGFRASPDRHGRPAAFMRAFAEEQEFAPTPGSVPARVDLHWHPIAPWWLRATLRIPEEALFAEARPLRI